MGLITLDMPISRHANNIFPTEDIDSNTDYGSNPSFSEAMEILTNIDLQLPNA